METKEKVVLAPESETDEEEVVVVRDVDIGLTKKDVEKTKDEVKKKVTEQHELTPQQEDLFQQILKEAEMPVVHRDTDFKLGKNELDVRYLNKENKYQMLFRQLTLNNVYAKQCLTSLIDVTRLLMIIADKLGVEDIVKATDEVIEKIEKANKIKEQLARDKKIAKAKKPSKVDA